MDRPGEERAGLNEATLGEGGMPGSRTGRPGMRAAGPASAGMVEGGAGTGDQGAGPAGVAGEVPPAEATRGAAAAAGDAPVVPGGAAATAPASGDGEAAGVAALEERLERFRERFARARREIERVVVGQPQVVSEVLWALLAGGHVLLEGVPGLGKTALVRALGRVLGLRFSRIQFT
ncbi:MAG TPA: MoxR family ATPase, partial [Thermaerobacter sp.]